MFFIRPMREWGRSKSSPSNSLGTDQLSLWFGRGVAMLLLPGVTLVLWMLFAARRGVHGQHVVLQL